MKSRLEFFRHPHMPMLIRYLASRRTALGSQLSPQHGTLGLSATCQVGRCQKLDTPGAYTQYRELLSDGSVLSSSAATGLTAGRTNAFEIITNCPDHGPQVLQVGDPDNMAWTERLVASGPVRTLLQSMLNLTDFGSRHVLITGADRAGLYHETTLLRPLAEWSATAMGSLMDKVRGRMPHILYAPLVTDWSGARLCFWATAASPWSTSHWASSYRVMVDMFGEGMLGRLFDEVLRWVGDSKMMFRSYSTLYLQHILEGRDWLVGYLVAESGQRQ
ncbi:uncharacterized protein B0T15DRAFT_107891 [Chaetomium strumarium]|uniref:Uncharacterized protein n=1 Tax=Chaetomium strumarium TaxID=1170767 RepID=A0AAJ0GYD2_9PEZI|nr:hypothetical protein B0T15DRAFT_107891 [Chaetomium strumarium]